MSGSREENFTGMLLVINTKTLVAGISFVTIAFAFGYFLKNNLGKSKDAQAALFKSVTEVKPEEQSTSPTQTNPNIDADGFVIVTNPNDQVINF